MRKAIGSLMLLGACVAGAFAERPESAFESHEPVAAVASAAPLAFSAAGGYGGAWDAPDAPPQDAAAVNPVFYDRPLMLRQYGVGALSGLLAGALGFYIGNAFEGAIFGSRSQKGYLSFTGIRYEHKRGPFWGGGAGLFVGSSLAVFFVGDMDEEQGSVLWTMAGGALSTAAAFALADAAGVQRERGMLAFVPLLALPPVGAVGGYHLSRWFNDRKRRRATEPSVFSDPSSAAPGPVLHAPRLGMAPGPDGGTTWRLDALNLTF